MSMSCEESYNRLIKAAESPFLVRVPEGLSSEEFLEFINKPFNQCNFYCKHCNNFATHLDNNKLKCETCNITSE